MLGINIGKTKLVEPSDAIADYARSAARLAPFADYLVVNVSSPNTPGLRDLQPSSACARCSPACATALRPRVAAARVPLLVKIAPDLADADIDAIADLALELGLDGIIATNTTIARGARHQRAPSSPPSAAAAALGRAAQGPLARGAAPAPRAPGGACR